MDTLHERANIKYAKWTHLFITEKPYTILSDSVSRNNKSGKTNVETEIGELEVIEDVRGVPSPPSLDQNGFQFLRHQFAIDVSFNVEMVEMGYLPEVKDLLTRTMGEGLEVHLFDWRMRKNKPYASTAVETYDLKDPTAYLQPAGVAHIDSTPASARHRVRQVMGCRAASLLSNRVRIINVWKPVNHTVLDCPLAVCDGRTVSNASLIATDHVTRDYVGEMYYLKFSPGHKWYYMSRQSVEDVLLFKSYDSVSSAEGLARFCPHAAFRHRNIAEGTLPRESIEVRAMIFG